MVKTIILSVGISRIFLVTITSTVLFRKRYFCVKINSINDTPFNVFLKYFVQKKTAHFPIDCILCWQQYTQYTHVQASASVVLFYQSHVDDFSFIELVGLFDDVKQAKLKIQITTIQVIKKQKKL